ncbi:MAG TPA: hypothetical protein VHT04_13990 [Stellaceae bacterium]|nr:hypothetical protein [Stellaceae bacterium]
MRDIIGGMRRAPSRALSAGGLTLLLVLAACQPLPQPFAEDAPPPDAPIMTLKDSAGIVVQPIGGGPVPLAAAMADALRNADVPASTQVSNRGSYVLAGTAEERPLSGDHARITLHWELRGPDGSAAGTYDQATESSSARWRAGDETLLKELVAAAAPAIAEMLQEEGAVGVDTEQRVAVSPVTGAPGDGTRSLARAMELALRQASVSVAEGADSAGKHFTVAGKVTLAPAAEGKQTVTVSWTLLDPDGSQIGQVNQENAIAAGSLDGRWGDVAYAVAKSAADGIVALLDHLKKTGGKG